MSYDWTRRIIVITLALIAMAGIGIYYHYKVQPLEPVWLSNAKVWDTPLAVNWDGHNESYDLALSTINTYAGCVLLVRDTPANVTITSADGVACGIGGEALGTDQAAGAWLCPDGTADIQISQPGDISSQYLIAQHELLHVLGLAHDAFSASIMMSGSQKYPETRITGKDAAALRERYCGDGREAK